MKKMKTIVILVPGLLKRGNRLNEVSCSELTTILSTDTGNYFIGQGR